MGEVAFLAPVAAQWERFAAQGRIDDAVDSHVRTLAPAVDSEVPEPDGRYPSRCIRPQQQLHGGLGHPVGTGRRDRPVLVGGPGLDVPVHRTAGRDDDALDGDVKRRLEQPLGERDVVAQVGAEAVAPAALHARTAGEMDHPLDVGQERVEIGGGQVDQDDVGTLELDQPRPLAFRREQVGDGHLDVCGEQVAHEDGPDEPCSTGDEHGARPVDLHGAVVKIS
jgi:hypothetical protein